MQRIKTERKLTNQRTFICRCDACLATLGPLQRKIGKWWRAGYGEYTKEFHARVRAAHKTGVADAQADLE